MKRHWKWIECGALVALLLLSACSQDELAEQGTALPEGECPLQIGSVTLSAEVSGQPWTRVAEDATDGKSSVWEWNGTETIRVQLGDETADYTLNTDKTLTPDKQLYWKNTQPATVTAWYPSTDGTISLADQSEGLAYVLQATVENATYDKTVPLNFTHQLAKVRVVLNGTQADLAQSVEVYGYTTCTNNEGAPVIDNAQQGWLKMKHTTYTDGTECWEANVVPGNITLTDFIRINGQTAKINNDFPTTLASGNMYTIDLTVGEKITVITADNCQDINDDGHYRLSGGFGNTITVTGGNPTIYLEGASINVGDGPAINITSGTPTIHVTGENTIEINESLSNCFAGIYVADGSSVTIEGNGTDDVLRVTGGTDGAAIGGYYDSGDKSCGDIEIKNVTLHAYAGKNFMFAIAPGIGATGGTCGRIEISSAIVYARGLGEMYNSAPAIGAYGSIPEIVITGSEIHAYRGSYNGTSYADYIGQGGNSSGYHGGDIQWSTGSITNSTIYCYSGTGNTVDKTMVYDASGNGTGLSQ